MEINGISHSQRIGYASQKSHINGVNIYAGTTTGVSLFQEQYMKDYSRIMKDAKKEERMSIIVAGITGTGITMAADSRSVRMSETGENVVISDETEKVFTNENMIIGTCGTSAVSNWYFEKEISEMVKEVLRRNPVSVLDFLNMIMRLHDSGEYSLIGQTSFLVCDRRENPHTLYEYLYSEGRFTLVNRGTIIPNVRIVGSQGVIPDYCRMDYACSFSQFEGKIHDMVQAVIDIGSVLERAGIVKKYHVGGHVRQKSISF